MEFGWSGSGQYLTAPIVVLSTELNNLQPSAGDVLAVSAPFSNSQGAFWADVEFIAGGTMSPTGDPFIEVWVIRSLDNGLTFEDGSATLAPARGADKTINLAVGTSITPHVGAANLELPPGVFKIAARNQTGVAIPTGSQIRLAEYGEAAQDDSLATMFGDPTGIEAARIADLMELFGVQTYGQSDAGSNPWGAGVSDYTTTSVIQALQWLTANSGLRCNIREYHLAGYDTGNGANQLSWCPTVATATGAKFSVALARGGSSTDATTLAGMVSTSSNTGWMLWAEGLETPNDGSVSAANCVTAQQTLYAGCRAARSNSYPVIPIGPSLTYATVPPEAAAAITGYLNATQKANVMAAMAGASVRFFPPSHPGANDSVGRAGYIDDVALGHQLYFEKPLLISEWHPTQLTGDSPSIAVNDSYGAYYAALTLLHAHRLGAAALFWKSLFDIGQVGDSPYSRVGLFPNAGTDTPRLPARTIRAMYALTGDTGSTKRSFKPSKLDYTVSGLPDPPAAATPWMGGHHRLYQNSGGTFYLFVWKEQAAPGGSGTTVTVSFARSMASVVHYDLTTDATTAETPVSTQTNITTLSFSLTGSVHLFVIHPQGSTAPSESAQGTTLTTTAGAIYDAGGVGWVLVSNPPNGYQVSHGSYLDGLNVVLLLIWDHILWYQNATGSWFYWSAGAWRAGTGDPRITAQESPEGTTVTGPGVTIYASQTPGSPAGATLDQWTLTTGAQAAKNGTTDVSTSAARELYYKGHVVYLKQDGSNSYGAPGWWSWSGASWAECPPPKTEESAEGAQVTTVGSILTVSQTPGVTGAGFDTMAISAAAQIVRNGISDDSTADVDLLLYKNHTAYHREAGGNAYGSPGWWSWTGSSWTAVPSPTLTTESTDRTTASEVGSVIYASQTPGSAAGGTVDNWIITAAGTVARNGTVDASRTQTLCLFYSGHYLYHQSTLTNGIGDTPGWWRWGGTTWTAVHSPLPTGHVFTIGTVGTQVTGQMFPISGTICGYTTAPSPQYRDNTAAFQAMPTGGVSVFADEFSSGTWMTHQYWASGDPWGYVISGSQDGATSGVTTWWTNPITTPAASSLYNLTGGALELGLMVNPGGLGITEHLLGTIINNFITPGGLFRLYGYHEIKVAVPKVNGFFFGFDIEDLRHEDPGNYPWSTELNLYIWTDGSNVAHVWFQAAWWTTGMNTYDLYTSTSIDITQSNTYAIDWQADYIRCYVNGVQVGSSWPNPGGDWQTRAMGSFIYTAGADYVSSVTPSDGSLPQHATIDYYHVYATKPTATLAWVTPTAFTFVHPAMTAQTMTVGVRDPLDGTTLTTSNSFTVSGTGTVTLTNITLSGTTVIAGSPAGTPIAQITVATNGGAFTGTLAVNDTAHFQIPPGTNDLQTAAPLSAGYYTITITATQAGATGSPYAKTFSNGIQVVAGGNALVNLAAPTGKTLKKTLFGFSVGESSGHAYFPNSTFRATANTYLKPALLRVPATWELPRYYAEGNTAQVNDLLSYYRSFCQTDVRVIMGCALNTSYSAATHATQAANFAAYLNSAGFSDILDWEVGNEWGSRTSGVPISTVVTYFNAVADALHAVNASYRVWGPPQVGPDGYDTAYFANQVGTRCAGVLFHTYDVASSSGSITDSLGVVYDNKGVSSQNALIQRDALADTPLETVPIGPLEYNMSSQGRENGQYIGAVWAACYLLGLFKSSTNVDVGALWGIADTTIMGAIANSEQGSSPAAVSPQGYFLGYAGQKLYGPEYQSSTTWTNLLLVATKPTASTFAIALVNYDLSASRTVALTLANGIPSGAIARWEIGKPANHLFPGGGTATDSFGNVWSVDSNKHPVANGQTDSVSNVEFVVVSGSTVWQEDGLGTWYVMTVTGTISSPAAFSWSPLASPPAGGLVTPTTSTQPSLGSISVPAQTVVILTGQVI